ncbi:MAG: cytochrome P450 [Gemmatimonadales bacterium]|jgi:cytochrome P450|nr:cytochrome P450 [Gemmatimonadales bacterium]MBT3499929.1 cytochrome P450 [Gemmatimonadales bacterium]MBT3774276.1 cytochrome P450 [Gemmatimonadales bacterium]MBT3957890.1 cytochrome P450 [Gemmatimonadales bacterium]MBT4188802.1 cytochrome P450 [Gemmatimonadales bacterium]
MSASKFGPVRSLETDFDHTDPEYNRSAPEIWAALRGKCPVAHSDRFGGVWLPLTHEFVREIAYDTEHFSSVDVVVNEVRGGGEAPQGSSPPITSDPPFHAQARRLLLPSFAPKKIAAHEEEIRAVCRARLDDMGAVSPGDVIDASTQFAQHIPVRIIGRMVGVPPEDDALLLDFVYAMLEAVSLSADEQRPVREHMDEYFDALIERHKNVPEDNLTTLLLNSELMGEPLDHRHIRGTITLLMIAGIDTTWSAIGSSLHHLATHPNDLKRMGTEADLMPTAIEELLRAYAPVTMARVVKKAVDFHGCPMAENEWVLLPFPAANRDPEVFERPDEVLLDRAENRHVAFGLGAHRCLGSSLARLELRVGLEEFMARFPRFELVDPAEVQWSVGQIRGPRSLPIRVLEVSGPVSSEASSP